MATDESEGASEGAQERRKVSWRTEGREKDSRAPSEGEEE